MIRKCIFYPSNYIIRKCISYPHKLITLYCVFYPYITPIVYLNFMTNFYYFTVFHWYLLDGRCWMSILEDKFKNPNEPKTNMLSRFKNSYIHITDLIIHLNFFVSNYNLDCFYTGLIKSIIILLLNKKIYGTFTFKSV